jgi:hypothetical protein
MGVNRHMSTEIRSRQIIDTLLPIGATALSGTYNGTATTAASINSTTYARFDRWSFLTLWDNFTDSGVYQTTLDKSYAGGDIILEVEWNAASTGNAYFSVGLCGIGTDGILGDETDSVYKAFAVQNEPVANQVVNTQYTFTENVIFKAGGLINVIVMRNGSHASDTIVNYVDVLAVRLIYNINEIGKTTI